MRFTLLDLFGFYQKLVMLHVLGLFVGGRASRLVGCTETTFFFSMLIDVTF